MTTLTATQARINLSALLRRALKGDDIGIVCEGKVIALRPVKVLSSDYALKEYGIKESSMKTISAKLNKKAIQNRKAKKSKMFKGNLESLLEN